MQAKISSGSDDLETLMQRAEQLLSSERVPTADKQLARPSAEETAAPATPDPVRPAQHGARNTVSADTTNDAHGSDVVGRLRATLIARVQGEERHRFRSWLIRHARFLRIIVTILCFLAAVTGILPEISTQTEVPAVPQVSKAPEFTASVPPILSLNPGSEPRSKGPARSRAGSVLTDPPRNATDRLLQNN